MIPDLPPEEEDALHERIVQAVGTGMNQLLPPRFRMAPDGIHGWAIGTCPRSWPLLDDTGQVEVERVVMAVESIMDRLQVYVTVALTVPWPPVEGASPDYFACPMAEWSEGRLRIWFASHQGPVTPIVEVPLVL